MSSGNRDPISVSIHPLNYADISSCASITASAFSVDPHTTVKNLGREPYDMYAISRANFLDTLEKKTYVYVKAVDDATGAVVGHAGWAFRGVETALVPRVGPADAKPTVETREQGQGQDKDDGDDVKVGKEDRGGSESKEEEENSIDRLHALEDADMQYWIKNLVPADVPCVFVVGLVVAPEFQSRGVGGALLRYGNAMADKLGLSIWVHSSHQAYEAYKKHGFETVRELNIDLDEYAPRGPQEGEEVMGEKGSKKWGRYIIRYMERKPKK
ncbi:acyl-CoA N-acyltransferase [Annulohypoxylon nitens]|nr:acyl-CoA N-acyltransferase [Annulohypoxylon nitens]